MIVLGSKVKDRVTDFHGIATGRTEYFSRSAEICITPPVGDDGKLSPSQWFDEARVEFVEKGITKIGFAEHGVIIKKRERIVWQP